MRSFR